jgi:hypothetical protein
MSTSDLEVRKIDQNFTYKSFHVGCCVSLEGIWTLLAIKAHLKYHCLYISHHLLFESFITMSLPLLCFKQLLSCLNSFGLEVMILGDIFLP